MLYIGVALVGLCTVTRKCVICNYISGLILKGLDFTCVMSAIDTSVHVSG